MGPWIFPPQACCTFAGLPHLRGITIHPGPELSPSRFLLFPDALLPPPPARLPPLALSNPTIYARPPTSVITHHIALYFLLYGTHHNQKVSRLFIRLLFYDLYLLWIPESRP